MGNNIIEPVGQPTEPTRGPWRWVVNRKSKQMHLIQVKGGDYVLQMERWGTQGAQTFLNDGELLQPAHAFAVPFPNQEHNASWYASLNHPDARCIEQAEPMYRLLKTFVRSVLDGEWQEQSFTMDSYEVAEAQRLIALIEGKKEEPANDTVR